MDKVNFLDQWVGFMSQPSSLVQGFEMLTRINISFMPYRFEHNAVFYNLCNNS